jgi:HEAT repeat protein
VLPALFTMVGADQQDNVRTSSAIALARIGNPEGEHILEALQALVRERDPDLREATTLALGIDGDPRMIPVLAAILAGGKDALEVIGYKPNDRQRAYAAYGLALVAQRAANDDIRRVALRPVLAHFLNTKERSDLRVALASALGMMRIEFDPKGAATESVRSKGKPTLPRYRGELIERLQKAYEDERDALVRGHLPIVLGRLLKDAPDVVRDPGIRDMMAALGEDPKPRERYGLVTALGIAGDAWGRPVDQELRHVLYVEAAEERESHARHLALMALSEVVTNSGPSLPPASVQKEFEDFLLTRFEEARSTDRPWLAMAAGSFGARLRMPIEGRKGARSKGRVSGLLVEKLRATVRADGSPDELSAAVLALGLIEDQAAAEDVEHLLDTTGIKDVRGYAALSLGLMGRTRTYDKLAILIDDLRYEPISLEHAAMGLALLDRTRGSALLRDRLAHARSGITAAPLAAAIGRVSDGASVLALARLAHEETQTLSTREFACIALGLISDRDDLTWRSHLASDVNYAAWTPTLFDTAGKGVLNLF